ncbi:MAG: aspartyl/glutamyl-tRNA amidotransferase subunit C [Aeropyrum sp.]|nr:aspartyl/glutamyl-tRNA amidotransferase subunit C [Aeropyrum sp.]MCE4615559.1 aspartyl/glutamyl-tRNA amidotransferase subunit C [Aeropyrum sp.]
MEESTSCGALERLVEIAKLELNDEERSVICRDLERISRYLSQVSAILENYGDVPPLYHVWEESLALRSRERDRRVSLSDFLDAWKIDSGGRVKVPWREVGRG